MAEKKVDPSLKYGRMILELIPDQQDKQLAVELLNALANTIVEKIGDSAVDSAMQSIKEAAEKAEEEGVANESN